MRKPSPSVRPLTPPRLIFVTGKGGAGKSAVAAALALALSRRRPATLADLDRRGSAAAMLAAAGKSDALETLALTPRAELEAFIHRIVPLRSISQRMLRSRTFGYVTAALPGLEAFLLLERLRLIAGTAALEDRYAVIDAPATGHALELLNVAGGIRGLAPAGTLNRLAVAVEDFIADPNRFGVILTVSPEELSLREALDAARALRETPRVGWIAAALNFVAAPLFSAAEVAALAAFPAHARLAEARMRAGRAAADARRALRDAGLGVIELPMVFAADFDHAGLETLCDRLERGLSQP